MIPILDLWLPILVAAALVFFVSSILHMVFSYHRSDYRQLPRESERLTALGDDLSPGYYMFPWSANAKEMATPEMAQKYQRGPVGVLTVFPSGTPRMGRYLALWFVYTLLVGVFVAYLAGRTLASGAHYLAVFRFTGTVAFVAYGLAHFADSIWKGQPWGSTAKQMFDGLLYSLVTAGAFGWLWPR